MPDWKDLLKISDKTSTLERARSGLGLATIYELGKGGFDPTRPLTKECDCSGFIAWAIGIPREFPPRTDRWMDTDAYWGGGGTAARAAGFPLLTRVDIAEAEPGDLIVYPDSPGGGQGHMGIISETGPGGLKVIHCSRGNFRGPRHDAIQETDAGIFTGNARTRVMRIDYPAMRRYSGVPEPEGVAPQTDGGGAEPAVVAAAGDGVVAAPALRHPLLADQPTLQLVVRGELKLQNIGKAVSGIGSVQQGMNILAREHALYAIDLGPNEANSGIFGNKTEKALKALQGDSGLPATGVLDSATLLALDALLVRHSELDAADDGEPEVAEVEQPTDDETEAATTAEPLIFTVSHEGSRWFATTGGVRFYVGTRVRYKTRWGLMNTSDNTGEVYDPADYVTQFGHWAYLVTPTSRAESSGYFKRINTYDRARFTFSFLQFAAHVPDGDFVKYFRALLALDESARYFPELELRGGRIVRQTSSGPLPLETATSTEPLMSYLNPSGAEVEDREVLSAAKFIHWCENSEAHRREQVRVGIETAKEKVRVASRKMRLDGRSDKVCLVVMDVLHQGRGTYAAMKSIVESNNDADAYTRLLRIGATDYAERISTIRDRVARLEADGLLGRKHYVAASNDFA